ATGYLVGRRDFKAFEGAGSPRAHTMRQVMRADLLRHGRCHLRFEIQAQGFLRYMVRNIVGTLVDVGRGDISAMQIPDILDARERSRAGATAPAQGLCLLRVEYPAASRISY
ncbi:MAG: tRNA pseudouridine(38-40) synthase TruA, partial [Desulfatitalea sp.]|nr:tRNA pseudouridine(38-40) synthase TruA [Desulfatitalea sp.]NNJ99287.1 tRNA pseudouridine(38-40) synthase TruA [Desulfatitalea sp.]